MSHRQTRVRPRRALGVSLLVMASAGLMTPGGAEPPAPGLPGPLAAKVRVIQKGLSELRGLEYREAIQARTMDERQVRDFLLRKLMHEYPDEKLIAEQVAWVHLGFLDPGDDLKRLFVGMLTEQAAGFYDPDDSRLIVVTGKAFPGLALVHELAHALADQVFDLGKLLNGARGDDDRLMAVSAMVEGEAQALSMTYVHSSAGAGMMEEEVIVPGESATAANEESIEIPPMLQHSFTFPYTQGMAWASEVARNRGQTAMDAFYREPPDSTEQIMHPEKSAPPRDLPSAIDDGFLRLTDPLLREAGYDVVKENVLGEFSIRELFGGSADAAAVAAAAGWDGDRFRIARDRGGRTAMIWITAWDSAADAAEFLDRAAVWLGGRHPDPAAFRIGRCGPEGRLVRVIEGFEPGLTERIASVLDPAVSGKVTLR